MKTQEAVKSLAALAHDTRLAIFRFLVEVGPDGEFAGKIAEKLKLPPATLSFHLKELSNAALVVSEQSGRFIRYAANYLTMDALIAYLTENCCAGNPELCRTACKPIAKKSKRKTIA
jgi:ArsR family transcriptional regulator, arsenate/arsenite/antimonite-responsive transcriptional repressor